MSYVSEGSIYAIYFVMMLVVALCYTGFSVGCMDILNFESASLLGRTVAYELALAQATKSNTVINIPKYCGLTPNYYIRVNGNAITIGIQSLLTGQWYSYTYHLPDTHININGFFYPTDSTKYFVVCDKYGNLHIHYSNLHQERPYLTT